MLGFLYHTLIGRLILRLLCAPALSRMAGWFLDRGASHILIKPFVRKNNIDLGLCADTDFKSFNDCFSRRLKPEVRPVDNASDALIAPCDALLSVYPIRSGSVFPAKQSYYSVADLLGDAQQAKLFDGGLCLVYRLCVHHYHRYIFFDDGREIGRKKITGVLHTVRPVALEQYPVFVRNARECTLIDTDHFGLAAQIEIGAMLVGKIENHPPKASVRRGEEKGLFRYGGSTIVVLLGKDRATIDEAYMTGAETPVVMGQRVGSGMEAGQNVC